MGFLSGISNAIGLSGSEKAGRSASSHLFEIGQQLRNFTPIRVRSAAGTGTYSQDGVNFDLDPRLTAGAGSGFDFFGNMMDKIAKFDQGDSTARTLALLRERRAPLFNSQLSALESRLMQQGRLGLNTGARSDNPEMASFFGAEAGADLEAQLFAGEEARRERAGMFDAAGRGLQMAMEASIPSQFMNSLFNAESLRSARDITAAKIQSGGPELEYKGAEADREARAGFYNNIISSAAKFFSDRRLKRNIRRIGAHPLGIGVYEYDMVWGGREIGVMADEVKQVKPDAVVCVLGFDVVDYGAL